MSNFCTVEVHRRYNGTISHVYVLNGDGERVGEFPITKLELSSHGSGTGEFMLTMFHNHIRFVEE